MPPKDLTEEDRLLIEHIADMFYATHIIIDGVRYIYKNVDKTI